MIEINKDGLCAQIIRQHRELCRTRDEIQAIGNRLEGNHYDNLDVSGLLVRIDAVIERGRQLVPLCESILTEVKS